MLRHRLHRLLLPSSLVLAAATVAPLAARADTHRERVSIERQYTVPCAAGGAGEVVAVTGEILIVLTSGGEGHDRGHWNAVFTGVGLTTGDKYQGTWIQNIVGNGNAKNDQSVYSERYSLRLVGPRIGFVVTGILRYVFDAGGNLRVEADEGRSDCGR